MWGGILSSQVTLGYVLGPGLERMAMFSSSPSERLYLQTENEQVCISRTQSNGSG